MVAGIGSAVQRKQSSKHTVGQVTEHSELMTLIIAYFLELMNATTKHYFSYYIKELEIVGQDLPVQFTLTQLAVSFPTLPLTHLGIPSEMYEAKKEKKTR